MSGAKEKLTLDDFAEFTWNFGCKFFMETAQKGNFVWSCPDYEGGDNTIVPYNDSYERWIGADQGLFGRDKGTHRIRDYCGEDVTLPE